MGVSDSHVNSDGGVNESDTQKQLPVDFLLTLSELCLYCFSFQLPGSAVIGKRLFLATVKPLG